MSTEEKIIRNKVGLLKLSEMLGSVSEASGLGAARGPLPWPAADRCGFPSFEGHAM